MTFTRTKEGIQNQSIFYGVDITVYCEGYVQDGGVNSLDELYWSNVLNDSGINCICKSIGAKSNVLDVLKRIKEQKIGNALVAYDRDYDKFFEVDESDPYSLMTFGYSWESDVLQGIEFRKMINLFAPIADVSRLEQRFNDFLTCGSKDLQRVCAIDIKYYNSSVALFNRKKPQEIIVNEKDGLPKLNIKRILNKAKDIHNFQSVNISAEIYRKIDGLYEFFGKTVLALIYRWCKNATRNISNKHNINLSLFASSLIIDFDFNYNNDGIKEHYQNRINEIAKIVKV